MFHSLPKALLPFFFLLKATVVRLRALGFFFLPFSPSLRRHTCPLKELAGCKRAHGVASKRFDPSGLVWALLLSDARTT